MKHKSSRRELFKVVGQAAVGIALAPCLTVSARGQVTSAGGKRVLFFTKSAGFQHSVIARPQAAPERLSYAEQIFSDLGAKNGFEVVCSKDGSVFSPENIRRFDVFAFYTTGDLATDSDKYWTERGPDGKNVVDPKRLVHREPAMPPGAKEALLGAIRDGKGFIGLHSATDTFHSPGHIKRQEHARRDVDEQGRDRFDPYIAMLGGEFVSHGAQQKATLKTYDKTFPGADAFHDARFVEEWYALKNFAPDLHVILAQDCTGMDGAMYQRPPFPQTWSRLDGKGRVFYTSLGHREDVWQKPEFLALIAGGLGWTSGRIDADVTPNIQQVTPEANPESIELDRKR